MLCGSTLPLLLLALPSTAAATPHPHHHIHPTPPSHPPLPSTYPLTSHPPLPTPLLCTSRIILSLAHRSISGRFSSSSASILCHRHQLPFMRRALQLGCYAARCAQRSHTLAHIPRRFIHTTPRLLVDPYAFDPYAKPVPTPSASNTPSPASSTSSSSSNPSPTHPYPPTNPYASTSTSSSTSSSFSSTPTTSDSADPADALRRQILEHALAQVPSLGWSEDSVRAAIAQMNLSPSLLSLLPSPVSSLISHFHHTSTNTSLTLLSHLPSRSTLTTSQALTQGLTLQLQQHLPYLSHLPQLIGLSLTHDRLPTTLSHISDYTDRLWYAVGDTATDMSWYGKRAAIASVYTATALHLATDRSAGQRDTWAFLERRMRDAERAQQAPEELSRTLEQYGGAAYNLVLSMLQQPSRQQ